MNPWAICRTWGLLALGGLAAIGCSHGTGPALRAESKSESPSLQYVGAPLLLPGNGPTSETCPALHNLLQITDTIYSGGEPDSDEAFASIAQLGIKTVVSVDGARPDVETARKYGLRYIHIPFGYDGINEEAGKSLARLVREVPGPYYVHCHHGKHRGPAAAAIASIAAGVTDGPGALSVLERAGTSRNYGGLWRDVENYHVPGKDEELPALVEVAEVSSLAVAMAAMDRASDNLALLRDGDWASLPEHPDLVAPQEALIVREGLRESARLAAGDYDERFRAWITDAESKARELETVLREGDLENASGLYDALKASCAQCHADYRN